MDRDCPSKMTCIRDTCANPCLINNPCSNSQQCVVTDTPSSLRSVACICPEGTLAGYGGTCEQGMLFLHCVLFRICISNYFFQQLNQCQNARLIMTVELKKNVIKEHAFLHVNLYLVEETLSVNHNFMMPNAYA